jgi:hypothetical protein
VDVVKFTLKRLAIPLKTRVKEHHNHIPLEHPDRLAIAEHSISLSHCIHVQDTSNLPKKSRHMDRMIREPTEIKLHTNMMNMRMASA